MTFTFLFPVVETFRLSADNPKLYANIRNGQISINVIEAGIQEFPLRYLLHEARKQFFENRWQEAVCAPYTEEIREFQGKFYRPVHYTFGSAVSKTIPEPRYLKYRLEHLYQSTLDDLCLPERRFCSGCVPQTSTLQDAADFFSRECRKYLICQNRLWEQCSEPMYRVITYKFRRKRYTELTISLFHNRFSEGEGYFPGWNYKQAMRYFRSQYKNSRSIPLPCRDRRIQIIQPINTHSYQPARPAFTLSSAPVKAVSAI